MPKLLLAVRAAVDLYRIPSTFAPQLQRHFPQVTVVALEGYDQVDAELPDTEIFVGWSLPAPKLALAKNLRWVHSLMTGVKQLLYPEFIASPVVLTNAATVHAPCVGEHAWALIMAAARRIPSAVAYQQKRQWAWNEIWHEQPRMFELAGLTLGVVGLGAIGQEVARRGRAFGMRVVAVKRRPEQGREHADEIYGTDGLHRLLAESDAVVLAVPDTAGTRNMIGAPELALMKPTALLVNVARGSLIDESALVRALEERRLGFAALDVTATEPLPPDSPLWRAPNCLITPHLSSATERLWQRHFDLLSDNLRRYLAGEPLLNVVDKQAGY